jgi:AcrR family transcriptional regulator
MGQIETETLNETQSMSASAGRESSVANDLLPVPDLDTRERVLQAALACIINRGFYRASSNEIARTTGVSWGVIQHHFGTREGLMLAVLQKGSSQVAQSVEEVHVKGVTAASRIDQLVDIFSLHYTCPSYLAQLQILLNMDRDPRTSPEVRETMRLVAERANAPVRRLLREALGDAADVSDLTTTIFLVLRGFGLAQQLLDSMSYDSLAPHSDRAEDQRVLLSLILTSYIERVESAGE